MQSWAETVSFRRHWRNIRFVSRSESADHFRDLWFLTVEATLSKKATTSGKGAESGDACNRSSQWIAGDWGNERKMKMKMKFSGLFPVLMWDCYVTVQPVFAQINNQSMKWHVLTNWDYKTGFVASWTENSVLNFPEIQYTEFYNTEHILANSQYSEFYF